jgi:hypothetical protein
MNRFRVADDPGVRWNQRMIVLQESLLSHLREALDPHLAADSPRLTS